MPSLEIVKLRPFAPLVVLGAVAWDEHEARPSIKVPQIFWADHSPWREANLWAYQKTGAAKFSTISRLMAHLLAYAKWLELERVDWWHFPAIKGERCLYRYRGMLLSAMRHGEIAPKTASSRMRAIVQFYRWVRSVDLLSPHWPMWQERQIGVRIADTFGFGRTLIKQTTDLAISAKSAIGSSLEGNLRPVTGQTQKEILEFVGSVGTLELRLMLDLGFRTGMRLGTIADLKLKTLYRATPDPAMPGFSRIQLGPNANPPVATKHGVNGFIPLHNDDLHTLIQYAASTRRLRRAARAEEGIREVLFLTKAARPYAGTGESEHRAVEMELSRLRRLALRRGITSLVGFNFHRTRATFGTNILRILLTHLSVADALHILRDLMLHADASTSLKYVEFVEKSKALSEASDEFTRKFLRLADA